MTNEELALFIYRREHQERKRRQREARMQHAIDAGLDFNDQLLEVGSVIYAKANSTTAENQVVGYKLEGRPRRLLYHIGYWFGFFPFLMVVFYFRLFFFGWDSAVDLIQDTFKESANE